MASIAEIGAENSKKPENAEGKVTIYFGIFFDGTYNHRLQVLLGKKYREKNKLGNTLEAEEREIAKTFKLDINQYDGSGQIAEKGELNRLEREKSALEKALQTHNDSDFFLTSFRQKKLDSVTDDLDFELSKFKYDETTYKGHAIQTNDFTNIAILEPFYRAKETTLNCDKTKGNVEYAYRIYVSGSGTEREIKNVGGRESIKGGGFGQGETGVVQKVIDAVTCVNSKLTLFKNVYGRDVTLNFHLFGFSRGATEARIFAHVVNKQKEEPHDSNSLWKYVFEGKDRLKGIIKNGNVSIPAMGIYDTVSSVGVLFKNAIGNKVLIDVENCINTWSKLHHQNLKDLGLNDLGLVDEVYHICALDEYRENFALVSVPEKAAKKVTQIYIPGCHADVGGGYSGGYDKKISFKEDSLWIPYKAKPYHLRKPQEGFVFGDDYAFSFSLDNLKKSLWFDEKKQKPDINESDRIGRMRKIISINRYSNKGYNFIGLRLMIEKFKSQFQLDDSKFRYPDDLKDIYKNAVNLKNEECLYPEEEQYMLLRSGYLHMSMDDGLVNSPNVITIRGKDDKTKNILSRIEYTQDYCNKVENEYQEYLKMEREKREIRNRNQMLRHD